MIAGFDHVVIAVHEIDVAASAYEVLLGRTARAPVVDDGVATTVIATNNLSVELKAPVGAGVSADRLRAAMHDGEGLKSLVFSVRDIDAAHQRAARVGLAPHSMSDSSVARSFRADSEHTAGLRLFFAERASAEVAPQVDADCVSGIDHIVVQACDLERAAALFGARLGLDMRLDREVKARRLMFFRCGDAVLEIVQQPSAEGRDRLWGLSWRVGDVQAARARLAAAGFDLSEVRPGAKPGTRVVTVRNRTGNVPTILIEASRKAD